MSVAAAHRVSVVVPVFNEEESLPQLHREVSAAFANHPHLEYELILVDDGSKDRSYEVMRSLYESDPAHVRAIQLRRNFGQTAAMAAGFDAATGDLIAPMDADLQNDPADIPRMVALIDEGYDVVSGWRADRKDKFVSRRLPSITANFLISSITRVRLHDYGCTLKIYKREVIEHMRLYGELHRFLPALASWAGAGVTEVKVNHRARQFGKTKYGIGRTIRVVLDLITIKFLLSYSTKPMQVFGFWGFVSLFLGFLAGAFTAAMKIFENQSVNRNGWTFVCIFFTLGGLQLIGMGILGEINVRTYYESQHKPVYTVRERLGKTDAGEAPPSKNV